MILKNSYYIGIDLSKRGTNYEKLKSDIAILIERTRGSNSLNIDSLVLEVNRVFDRHDFDDNIEISKEIADMIVNYFKYYYSHFEIPAKLEYWTEEMAWLPNFSLELKIRSNMEKTKFHFDF